MSFDEHAVAWFGAGEQIILYGGGVAAVSFFLPWLESTNFLGQVTSSISGVGLAKQFSGIVALELVFAAGAIGLVLLRRRGPVPSKIMVAGWEILLGSSFALIGIAGVFMPFLSRELSMGWWGATLGYVAIIVGAFVMLRQLAYPPCSIANEPPGSSPSKPPPDSWTMG